MSNKQSDKNSNSGIEESAPIISAEGLARQKAEQEGDAPKNDNILINKEYEALQEEILAQKTKAEKQWDIAVRAKAEMENIRRRAERDVENAHKYGVEKLLNALLPVLDSLEQGVTNINQDNEQIKPLYDGIVLTVKMFSDVLAKFGIVEILPSGQVFDPTWHEAISMIENQEMKPGTIMHVVQKGYKLHERLVRPARVIVVKAQTITEVDKTDDENTIEEE